MPRPKRKASALIIHPLVPLAKASKVLRIEQSILVEKLLAGEILGENRTTELSKADKKGLKKSGEPDTHHWYIYASEFNRLLDERLAQYERRISTDGLDQFFTSPEFRLDNSGALDLPDSLRSTTTAHATEDNSDSAPGQTTGKAPELTRFVAANSGADSVLTAQSNPEVAQVEIQAETQAATQVETQVETQVATQVATQVETQVATQEATQVETQEATQVETQEAPQLEAQTETQVETEEAATEITLINVYEPQQQITATMDAAAVVAELVQHLRDEIAYRHHLESRIEELASEVAYLRSEIMQQPAEGPLKRLGNYLRLFFRDVKALYQ